VRWATAIVEGSELLRKTADFNSEMTSKGAFDFDEWSLAAVAVMRKGSEEWLRSKKHPIPLAHDSSVFSR
jgi:hypothetical protein